MASKMNDVIIKEKLAPRKKVLFFVKRANPRSNEMRIKEYTKWITYSLNGIPPTILLRLHWRKKYLILT
ncbi:MAG: hypothetical protein ACFFCS_03585 [Candidatus Hodarchaeota archaeon]